MEKIEKNEQHQILSQEVFTTTDQLVDMIEVALDNGTIKIEPFVDAEGKRPDIYASVEAQPDEITLKNGAHFLSDGSGYFDASEFDWTGKDGIIKEAESIQEIVVRRLGFDVAPWYLKDELLEKKVDDNEPLVQAFELKAGNATLQLLNFSREQLVSKEQLELLRKTLASVVAAGGSAIMGSVNGVAIVGHDDLNGGSRDSSKGSAIGLYKNYNGVLFLSDKLFGDSEFDTTKYGLDQEVTRLETTFAHELGHAAQHSYWDTFQKSVGWQESQYEVIDDYGNVSSGTMHTLHGPAKKQKVFRDGEVQEVEAVEHFGETAIADSKPNTAYGATRSGEDFAESTVPYFLEGRHTDKIDPIRLEAISTTLHQKATSGEVHYGPFMVEAREISFDELKTQRESISVPQKTITVKISASVKPHEKKKYNRYEKIVDDYGNEVTGVRPPAYYE